LPDNSILITANTQSETGFPSSHQLKSYVADAGFLVLSLAVEALQGKCVKTRCLQQRVGHLDPRFQGEGVVPCQYIDTARKAIDCATTLRLTF